MRTVAIIALLLSFAFSATALDAHFEGSALCIQDGKTHFAIADLIDEHAFYSTIHAIHRRGPDYFIVFGVSEFSRGWPPRGGHCGCDVESYIKWIHVKDQKIIEESEGRFESCFRNIYDSSPITWKNGQLIWSACISVANGYSSETGFTNFNYSWTYDPLKPEQGIIETKRKVEQGAAVNP